MTKPKSTMIPPKSETALDLLKSARATLDMVSKRHMLPGSLRGAKTHFENALVELQADVIERK